MVNIIGNKYISTAHLLFKWVTTIVSKIFWDQFQVIDTRWSCVWTCSCNRENRHVSQPSQYKQENNIRSNNNYKSAYGFQWSTHWVSSNPLRKGDSVILVLARLWSLLTNYSDVASLHLTYHKFITLLQFFEITASSETTRPNTCGNRSNILNWYRFQPEGKGGDRFMRRKELIIDYRPNGQPNPKFHFKIDCR